MRRLELVLVCDEPWSEMRPEGRGRRCARCDEVVVDLGGVTHARALQLVEQGARCVSFVVGPDGAPVFRPEPSRVGAIAGAAASLLVACGAPDQGAAAPTGGPQPVVTVPVAAPASSLPVAVAPSPLSPTVEAPAAPVEPPTSAAVGPAIAPPPEAAPEAADCDRPTPGSLRARHSGHAPARARLGGRITLR